MVPVSWMKGADIIVCTVYLWFLSAYPLSRNMRQLRAVLDRRLTVHACDCCYDVDDSPAFVIEDALALSVLAFSAAICVFCMQCVRIIWPRAFRGERHSAISKIVAMNGGC